MKPMLAVDHNPAKLQFPVWASPKLDGLRGLVHGGRLLSRSLKEIPNRHVQSVLGDTRLNGLDGELIAGSPTAHDCMQACTSFFMARDKVEEFTWSFHVFDLHDRDQGFDLRLAALKTRVEELSMPNIVLHEQVVVYDEEDLLAYEADCLEAGYEGLILRKIDGAYKFGRSTVNEGLLLKVKRFTDGEAVIVGFEEQMENTNEKTTNELGRSKRSSHKAGKVGKNTLGALIVRDVITGVSFNIGTGMDDETRAMIWADKMKYVSTIVKYKSFLIGVKDAPRHPVFLGFRHKYDMS